MFQILMMLLLYWQYKITVKRDLLILLYTYINCYRLVVDYKYRPYPNRLRVIRQNAGYTQQQVAQVLGHHDARTLCIWEKEKAMPNGTNLIRLCILYDKTPRELYPEYYHCIKQQLQGL